MGLTLVSKQLVSVHADGNLVFWSHTKQEPAVCKLTWAEECSFSSPRSSTFSDNGQYIFVTGRTLYFEMWYSRPLIDLCSVVQKIASFARYARVSIVTKWRKRCFL